MTTGPVPRRGALALLAATQLLLIMDTAIVNVALPSVGEDLTAGSADLSWVANAYLITFGGLLLLGGRTADLLGHRRVFLGGLHPPPEADRGGGDHHVRRVGGQLPGGVQQFVVVGERDDPQRRALAVRATVE
ncbi:MFS transporter, partial [Streptomyces sp. NPDC057675]|uniref:MFS transporter n=1 Tax=Streptomyces sp. NPDC057675 TaxID=3346204 RepID=UPI0036A99E94